MKEFLRLLAMLCLLAVSGCTGMNALNREAQGTVNRPIDIHNVIVPLYHKDI